MAYNVAVRDWFNPPEEVNASGYTGGVGEVLVVRTEKSVVEEREMVWKQGLWYGYVMRGWDLVGHWGRERLH
ncbi:MAG: hypothetical protein GY845_36805 [Planctomycetes bacterium]|nr:hypothetical protein [Planctomycetota bacterium]